MADELVFDKTGIPDLRIDNKAFYFDVFLPKFTQKSVILGPKKEKRDWLANLFMAKPDYEDPHKKVYYASFFGAKFAALSGILEVGSQKSRNPQRSLRIIGKNFLYIGGAAFTYGAVSTAVANLRGKKDDVWNHAIAGASIGFIYGYGLKTSGGGAAVAAFGAIAGALFKKFHLNQRQFFQGFEEGPRKTNFMNGNIDLRIKGVSNLRHDPKTRAEFYNFR